MRRLLERFLNKQWYHQGKLIYALAPLQMLYRFISNAGYIRPSRRLHKPIWVVGNLTVGGAGKTPFVIWLVKNLMKKGLRVLVVVKPYRCKLAVSCHEVGLEDDPKIYGDEAVLIKKETLAKVVSTRSRSIAIKNFSNTADVVVVDDGLQDVSIHRSSNICIVDQVRMFGNKQLLPVGPLRSSLKMLDNTDFMVLRGHSDSLPAYTLEIKEFFDLKDANATFKKLPKSQNIIAACAIGDPNRFFNSLKHFNVAFEELVMPDHHHWSYDDFRFYDKSFTVIVTEKDAVKLNFEINCNVLVAKTELKKNEYMDTVFIKLLKQLEFDDTINDYNDRRDGRVA